MCLKVKITHFKLLSSSLPSLPPFPLFSSRARNFFYNFAFRCVRLWDMIASTFPSTHLRMVLATVLMAATSSLVDRDRSNKMYRSRGICLTVVTLIGRVKGSPGLRVMTYSLGTRELSGSIWREYRYDYIVVQL